MQKRIAKIYLILAVMAMGAILWNGWTPEASFYICWCSIMYYGENIMNKLNEKEE